MPFFILLFYYSKVYPVVNFVTFSMHSYRVVVSKTIPSLQKVMIGCDLSDAGLISSTTHYRHQLRQKSSLIDCGVASEVVVTVNETSARIIKPSNPTQPTDHGTRAPETECDDSSCGPEYFPLQVNSRQVALRQAFPQGKTMLGVPPRYLTQPARSDSGPRLLTPREKDAIAKRFGGDHELQTAHAAQSSASVLAQLTSTKEEEGVGAAVNPSCPDHNLQGTQATETPPMHSQHSDSSHGVFDDGPPEEDEEFASRSIARSFDGGGRGRGSWRGRGRGHSFPGAGGFKADSWTRQKMTRSAHNPPKMTALNQSIAKESWKCLTCGQLNYKLRTVCFSCEVPRNST